MLYNYNEIPWKIKKILLAGNFLVFMFKLKQPNLKAQIFFPKKKKKNEK